MDVCPVDFRPCMDDLCHGGGCLRSPYGEEMLTKCPNCGSFDEPGLGTDLCAECAECADVDDWDGADDWDDR